MHSWFNLHLDLQSANCLLKLLLDASEICNRMARITTANEPWKLHWTMHEFDACSCLLPVRSWRRRFPPPLCRELLAVERRIAMCCWYFFEMYLGVLFGQILTWFDFSKTSQFSGEYLSTQRIFSKSGRFHRNQEGSSAAGTQQQGQKVESISKQRPNESWGLHQRPNSFWICLNLAYTCLIFLEQEHIGTLIINLRFVGMPGVPYDFGRESSLNWLLNSSRHDTGEE